MTRIQIVSPESLRGYVPNHLLSLSHDSKRDRSFALQAESDGIRSGAVLTSITPDGQSGLIRHLHVLEPFRELGIGNQLLHEAESRLEQAGCKVSYVEITENEGGHGRRFYFNRGYSIDQTLFHQFTFRMPESLDKEEEWLRLTELPDGYELIDWAEIENRVALDPLADSELSKGLTYHGQLVGWQSIQRIATNMLLFRTLHAEANHRMFGQGIALACEMIRRHALHTQYRYIRMAVAASNKPMLRFIHKRLHHHMIHRKTSLRLRKPLSLREYG
ncbi:GNAT superfamily N-acetyltransferase [Paenibacillus phyllosphaerae]|uniref:GNAT superfamily N-acetyltransferase n=1 Tax=Paenibacillus phyllosphaerae TaxID=274593 RepID=A0A7W5AZL2_9BACL|nr:GNAT family N-acetyltransferase [Paenibacillus phyllosphaerae]MBB3111694.1 GNAT superfamily N-acetyltransferase [Paenibacillus phyllosphaerae]